MKEISSKEKNLIKIVLIGNSGVGKTCISQRYVNDSYIDQKECSTIGSSYFVKNVYINGKEYTLDIWDTAGQEKYRSLGRNFYREAYIIILVYDITRQDSLEGLKTIWYPDLLQYGENYKILAVVGNKCDRYEEEETVSDEEARSFAKEIKAQFFFVSAKTGDNIQNLFNSLIEEYWKPNFQEKISEDSIKRNFSYRIKPETKEEKETQKKKKKKKFC